MKPTMAILALLVAVAAAAQQPPGMSAADMQDRMQQMQGMQSCLQGIDQSRLQAFEQRARQLETEVKSLCAGGRRTAAQQKAIAFAREVAGDPDIRKIRQCGEMMGGMLPDLPYLNQSGEPDTAAGHVCDQL